MYRIDNATAATVQPAPGAVGPKPNGFFTVGGGVVPPTIVDADWANAVQEELGQAVEGAGLTLDKTKNNQLLAAVQLLAGQAGAHGQCQLRLNGANLKLSPAGGNRLIINGVQQSIPSGGIFLAPTGLTPTTAYFIYAANFSTNVTGTANNGSGLVRLTVATTAEQVTGNTVLVAGVGGTTEANGTWVITVIDATHIDLQGSAFAHAYVSGGTVAGLVLEASVTGHSTAASGVETKSSDVSRTLVGLARVITGPAFQDAEAQRFVISWFNRRALGGHNFFAAPRSTSSTTTVELSSTERAEFLSWADEAVRLAATGSSVNVTSNETATTEIGIDGTTPEDTNTAGQAATVSGAPIIPLALFVEKSGLAEGYHFATLLGFTQGGTNSWSGSASPGARCTIYIGVRG